MASAPASRVTRRRQRSTRLTVAVSLLVIAALAVIGAVVSGSWLLVCLAAPLGVLLGAAATKITHSELRQSRRDAARDRAEQAQAYRRLTEERTAEHAAYVEQMQSRIAEREETLVALQEELGATQKRAADVTRKMNAEARRGDVAEHERDRVVARLDDAESRAADAIVRMVELEQEVVVLRAELETVTAAWREAELVRKRA